MPNKLAWKGTTLIYHPILVFCIKVKRISKCYYLIGLLLTIFIIFSRFGKIRASTCFFILLHDAKYWWIFQRKVIVTSLPHHSLKTKIFILDPLLPIWFVKIMVAHYFVILAGPNKKYYVNIICLYPKGCIQCCHSYLHLVFNKLNRK